MDRNRSNIQKAIDKLEKARGYFNDSEQYKNCVEWALEYIRRDGVKKSCTTCVVDCESDALECKSCNYNYSNYRMIKMKTTVQKELL